MIKSCMKLALVFTIVVLLFGCAGSTKYMRDVADSSISYMPGADEAVVVFMRPSGLHLTIRAAVFDATSAENKLVGIVSAKKKVAYRTKPGKYLFMVIGENADFMQADLEAGKTYYARVDPRMGYARFSLGAVHRDIDPSKLSSWQNRCAWVETTGITYNWANQNAPSFQSKREDYINKWNNKPDHNKPTLSPEDGF